MQGRNRSVALGGATLAAVAALTVAGCAPTAGPTEASSGRPSRAVHVTPDVTFASRPPTAAWTPPLLDVYAPDGAAGLPLVVLFPAHSLTKTSDDAYPRLATSIAGGGAVVVVANWSETGDVSSEAPSATAALPVLTASRDIAACAVSYAVAHADEYGADPTRLVLAGHFYGANVASAVAFGPFGRPQAYAGCLAPAGGWAVDGLVGWDGDWLLGMPTWNRFGADSARLLRALTPWGSTAVGPPFPVTLAVSDTEVSQTRTCDAATTPQWVAWRDPLGDLRARLAAVLAFDDGCVDAAEAAEALADELNARSFPTTLVALAGPSGSGSYLDAADHDRLTAEVLRLASGTAAASPTAS